jgi:hypothetical protein
LASGRRSILKKADGGYVVGIDDFYATTPTRPPSGRAKIIFSDDVPMHRRFDNRWTDR